MLFEIFLGLSALGTAGGVFLFKNRHDLGSLKNVVKLTLSDVEEQLQIPERILPYSPRIMESAKQMSLVLARITHIMTREKNPHWNRYTSLTARFNLMLTSHYDEDTFLHLTQEKRKFFSVFIPQVVDSLDFKAYDRTPDKRHYMTTFQDIYDYCLEIVSYYEEYRANTNNRKLSSIQEAIAESRGLSYRPHQALPVPESTPLLTMEDLRFNALNITYHDSNFGTEIRIRPIQNIDVTEDEYTHQLLEHLNKLFSDKEKVRIDGHHFFNKKTFTYTLQKPQYNHVSRSFDLIVTPLDYYLKPLIVTQSSIDTNIMDQIVLISLHTSHITFWTPQ